jgi:hypothetical protein
MITVTGGVRPDRAVRDERPAVEERILAALGTGGARTLEQLAAALPDVSWPQVFLAIDRLSRSGGVILRRTNRGDYQASLSRSEVRGV